MNFQLQSSRSEQNEELSEISTDEKNGKKGKNKISIDKFGRSLEVTREL